MCAVGMENHHDRRPACLPDSARAAAATFGRERACNLSPNYFAPKSYFAAGFRNSAGRKEGRSKEDLGGNLKWRQTCFIHFAHDRTG